MFRVMIVDDVEVLRRDVRRLKLWGEASGFVIAEEASDGQDALKKLESASFDLIITDIRMPKMDGIELLRTVSEKKLCPVTVLLSDFTEYNYARQGFLYGAFDYIGKPVDETELAKLLARIRRHLEDIMEEERKQRELRELAEDAIRISDDVKQIILHIRDRNPDSAVLAYELIDMIYDLYPSDYPQAQHIVKNTAHEIIDETLLAYPWLEKFIDFEDLTAPAFSGLRSADDLKQSVKSMLEKLISMICKLMGSQNSELVNRACEYVLTHVEEEISVKLLSEKLYVNKSHLSEIFKQKFGATLLQYINTAKMERAKKLLQEGELKNYEIAELLGFHDYEYFGRLFKKYVGVLPRDYKN